MPVLFLTMAMRCASTLNLSLTYVPKALVLIAATPPRGFLTTAEAASHTGGDSGKGGDPLQFDLAVLTVSGSCLCGGEGAIDLAVRRADL